MSKNHCLQIILKKVTDMMVCLIIILLKVMDAILIIYFLFHLILLSQKYYISVK